MDQGKDTAGPHMSPRPPTPWGLLCLVSSACLLSYKAGPRNTSSLPSGLSGCWSSMMVGSESYQGSQVMLRYRVAGLLTRDQGCS